MYGPELSSSQPQVTPSTELKNIIAQNQLLNMISDEKYKGVKSVRCACGKKSALLERPTAYQA